MQTYFLHSYFECDCIWYSYPCVCFECPMFSLMRWLHSSMEAIAIHVRWLLLKTNSSMCSQSFLHSISQGRPLEFRIYLANLYNYNERCFQAFGGRKKNNLIFTSVLTSCLFRILDEYNRNWPLILISFNFRFFFFRFHWTRFFVFFDNFILSEGAFCFSIRQPPQSDKNTA